MSMKAAKARVIGFVMAVSVWLGACLNGVAQTPAVPARGVDVTLNEKGIAVAIKDMGNFTLEYPVLEPGKLKPVQKEIAGKAADLTYAGDIKLHIEVAEGCKVNLSFSNAGALKTFKFETMILAHYGDYGGTWTIGKGEPQPFPAQKPAKAHLYQGRGGGFTLTDVSGHIFAVTGFPDYAFQEMIDLREWNWKTFYWHLSIPYNADMNMLTLVFSEKPHSGVASAAAPTKKVLVDRFGQATLKAFPGKIKSEAELKADVAGEKAYWASYKPQPVDKWGGMPGSKEKYNLEATGFFRVEKKNNRWLLVNPDGNVTFHLGLCGFTYNLSDESTSIKDRRDIFEWIPPLDGEFSNAFDPANKNLFSFYAANVIRKYGQETTKEQQIGRLIDRVRAVGFNAAGAFYSMKSAYTEKNFPRTDGVNLKPYLPGMHEVGDPFDDAVCRKLDADWAEKLTAQANDPLIIGYFFANEQQFTDIPRAVPQLSGKYAAKRKLVEMLQKKYPTIAEFNTAWNLQVLDFAALADKGLPVATPAAFTDMQAYTELFLETYFRLITETFRKYDKNHLMIGNRMTPATVNNETVCRIAGKYMDVISVNYYAWGIDRTFLERVYKGTGGKPLLFSEFFYSSGPESNVDSYNLDMPTQKARGEAYRNYVEQAASLGFVVGVQWYNLIDRSVCGLWWGSSERVNNGLFNVCDRPYDAMLREMAKAHDVLYDVLLNGKKPFQIDDSRFIAGATKARKLVKADRVVREAMKMDGIADGWPASPAQRITSEHLKIGRDGSGLEASFRLGWDAANLYLLVTVTDPTPLNNDHEGVDLWHGDAVEVLIGSEKLDQPGELLFTDRHVLLGAHPVVKPGSAHVVKAATQPVIQMVNVPSVDGTGYTMEAAIPWSALDIKPVEDLELLFDMAIDNAPPGADRAHQILWNGGSSGDRTYWGRLKLNP